MEWVNGGQNDFTWERWITLKLLIVGLLHAQKVTTSVTRGLCWYDRSCIVLSSLIAEACRSDQHWSWHGWAHILLDCTEVATAETCADIVPLLDNSVVHNVYHLFTSQLKFFASHQILNKLSVQTDVLNSHLYAALVIVDRQGIACA